MDRNKNIFQAYKLTPWRKQFQVIGLVSASVVFVAIIAGVYLNVTARAATYGREIQALQGEAREIEREIEDLQSNLAILTSSRDMKKRAKDFGFISVNPVTAIYLEIPTYPGDQPIELAPELGPPAPPIVPQLPPRYTQSLFEWFREALFKIGQKNSVVE